MRRYRAAELIGDLMQTNAEWLRQKATTLMADDRISPEERELIRQTMQLQAIRFEFRARWWKTGEGPAP